MDKSLKEVLPLGSVILLAGREERVMIIGHNQVQRETKQTFDYSGVLFPKGYQGSESLYYFDREEIVYIFQMGLTEK